MSSQSALVQLSLVNSRFHTLAEPHLYRNIIWAWGYKSRNPPIFLLLRSIITRTKLAPHIKRVDFRGDDFYKQGPYRSRLPPGISTPRDEIEVKNMIDVIDRSRMMDRKKDTWYREFWYRVEDGMVTMDCVLAVLLPLLPNLTTLCLGPNFIKETRILTTMMINTLCHPLSGTLPKFNRLQEIYFSQQLDTGEKGGRRSNTLFVLSFFYAPNIKHISSVIDEPLSFIWPSTPPTASTLTSLHTSVLRENSLGEILQHCPNLKSLSYHFFADPDCMSPPAFLNCFELGKSLSHVQHTLTSLTLSGKFDTSGEILEENETDPGMHGTITSLPSFPSLERLEVPLIFLVGWDPERSKKSIGDLLPRSVKWLTLTDDFVEEQASHYFDEGKFLGAVTKWLGSWRETTPFLEKLCLEFGMEDKLWGKEEWERIRDLNGQFGLEVEINRGVDSWRRFH